MSAAIKHIKMYPVNEDGAYLLNEPVPGGYYIIARKIDESEIAHTPPHVREIFNWLIKKAYLSDRIICGRPMKRGQYFTSYKDIQDGLHWMVGYRKETYTKSQCETAMKWLTKHSMITTMKTTRGLIITLCKYDTYQNPKNYDNRTESHNRTTTEPQSSETIYEEGKEYKEYIDTNTPTDTSYVPDGTTKKTDEVQEHWKTNYELLSTSKDKLKDFLQTKKPAFINPYVTYWNLVAEQKGWPKIKELTATRKKKLKTRLSEKSFDFTAIIDHAEGSNVEKRDGGVWFSFDWMLESQKNYIKMLEGNYKQKITSTNHQAKTDTDAKLAERQRLQEANAARFRANG